MVMRAANDNVRPSLLGPFIASPAPGLALIGLLALVPVVATAIGETFWITLATRMAIFALAALSLSFVLGQGGLVSFGHAAPIGIGAYVVLIAEDLLTREIFVVLPLAFAAGAAFTAATGAIALRTRGVYFIMITLAFAQMAYFSFFSLSAYGGDDGMSLAGRSLVFGQRLLKSDVTFAYVAVGLLAAVFLALDRVTASRFGRVFRGLRQNEARLAALGFDAFSYRLTAYALSGGLAGVAGALLANDTEFVSPALMNWHRSGELIVMVALGGLARLHGAVLGAILVIGLEEVLSNLGSHAALLAPLGEHWKLLFGLILVAVVLARGLRAETGRP
jgi:branched-chain amino acid transport system permease protein